MEYLCRRLRKQLALSKRSTSGPADSGLDEVVQDLAESFGGDAAEMAADGGLPLHNVMILIYGKCSI